MEKKEIDMLRRDKVVLVKIYCSEDEKSRIQKGAREQNRTDSNFMLNLFLEREADEKSK